LIDWVIDQSANRQSLNHQMHMADLELWRRGTVSCVMVSCCAGAELQLRDGDTIVLRELYPTKGDLYERARVRK
jgi:hypothetical protein